MVETHEPWDLKIGDTWQIQFTCYNYDDTIMTLPEGVEIIWKIDDIGNTYNWYTFRLSDDNDSLSITSDVNGTVLVQVKPEQSARFVDQGIYADELTIIKNGVVSTMCEGQITTLKKLR